MGTVQWKKRRTNREDLKNISQGILEQTVFRSSSLKKFCPARNHDLSTCRICCWAATKKRILEESNSSTKRNKKILHFIKQNCNFKLSMIYKKGALFLNEDQSYNNSNRYHVNFGACTMPSSGSSTPNPFFSESSLYLKYPPFDKIKNEHYAPAFELGMKQHMQEIDSIALDQDLPSFENTILSMEKAGSC